MTMKNGSRLMLVMSILASGGHASMARADDDYGCRIVICLGNPSSNGGPWAPATCGPAMDHLMNDLRHGRGWPQCKDSDMTVRQDNTPYDPCPAGTTAAAAGAWVAEGQRKAGARPYSGTSGFALVGTPRPSVADLSSDNAYYGSQACVGSQVGAYQVYGDPSGDASAVSRRDGRSGRDGGGDDGDSVTVTVYDHIVWQPPQSPNAVDVYEAGQFQTRIHY
ncbi:hypothetical protein B0G75_12420 [Paraburkholderia sp. BL18I3N2]|uniref:hypothetical protein n=1 Tax=unclassified Paraburkholderia TaxID=2615204 RepID=UPI000D078C5D|nr:MULTISPECIES: hypothetical protein [unclassified Paraburkholderia]PRX23977.1 hypothetical protein B0G75_12420 [Paraburkholderia sp. BL18I3N2]PRX95955.1 hypothetical protein B0G73_13164 [Paraburkholderia sp. BL25I1N1]